MFSWLRNIFGKPSPAKAPSPGPKHELPSKAVPPSQGVPSESVPPSGNPAKAAKGRLSVNGPAGSRDENIDCVQLLSGEFSRLGREHVVTDFALIDNDTGVEFRPGLVSFQPSDDLKMRTCATIEIRHPRHFTSAFFEYQHSFGDTGEQSIAKGFEAWAKVDLPVILDSLRVQPASCMVLEMELPSAKKRRILLGPVNLVGPIVDGKLVGEGTDGEHPPFCNCCMFMRSEAVFRDLLNSDGFYAIRFYAMRNEDGSAEADCRVNGEDYPAGVEALIAYCKTWPHAGFEARKQYVIIQDKP